MNALLKGDTDLVSARSADPSAAAWLENEKAVELGIWLAGLRSFARTGTNAFFSADAPDRSREARVLHASLIRAAMLASLLEDPASNSEEERRSIGRLMSVLRDHILVGGDLVAHPVSHDAYNSWRRILYAAIDSVPATGHLIAAADEAGGRQLPPVLLKLIDDPEPDLDTAELALILPRFGRVLRYLKVVGAMLDRDEPLKPAVLVFSCVHEMVRDLTGFINGRLERFHDTEAEMFATLDAASYTASMELKKVYSQELAGVSSIRPAPSVYARTETAYALLNDGFHLILAGFAKAVDPKSDIFEIFPEFRVKRDRSIVLKRELDSLIRSIQAAEETPELKQIDAMNAAIREFMLETVNFLFYKDTETIERFVEEIAMTRPNSDLVPLLHRFGAYLDTLLGQVSLRSVLSSV